MPSHKNQHSSSQSGPSAPAEATSMSTSISARWKNLSSLHNLAIFLGAFAMFMGYTALPFYCPLIILVFPPCLFWLALTSPSGSHAFKRGWYLGLWGYSASLYWLTVPMTTVGEMPLLMAIPCVMLLGSFLGLYTGLTAFCFRGLLAFFNGVSPSPKVFPLSLLKRFHQKETAPSCQDADIWNQQTSLALSVTGAGQSAQSSALKSISGHLPLPSSPLKALCLFLLAGLCYGGVELASAHILTGFPWLSLPVALAETPLFIQPVNLIGAYGYSAALSGLSLCPFLYFLPKGSFSNDAAKAGPRPKANAFLWPILYPSLVIILIISTTGLYSYSSLSQSLNTKSIQVGIAQSNIDQNQKWLPPLQRATVQKYFALSRKAMDESPSPLNLLLWSETAMPFFYQSDEPYRSQINDFARQNNVSIGFGTLGYIHTSKRFPRHFNRLQLVSPDGLPHGHYDKEHLVPFGEYNPIPLSIPFLDNILQGVDFSAGNNQPLLALPRNIPVDVLYGTCPTDTASTPDSPLTPDSPDESGRNTTPDRTDKTGKIGMTAGPTASHSTSSNAQSSSIFPGDSSAQSSTLTALKSPDGLALTPKNTPPLALLGSLICYEVIFPKLAQERVAQGAHILVTISNDSWFGKTAAPQQHLNHAVLRAVEQNRSVIRSTSSGYSALILPNGIVRHKSALYEEDAYSFSAPLSKNTTIYHIFYQAIDGLLLLGLCIAVVLGVQFRRCGLKHPKAL